MMAATSSSRLFRDTEGNECCGMQAERAGLEHRGDPPYDPGLCQFFHPVESRSGSAMPSLAGDRFPWPGYQREVILQAVEDGKVGRIRGRLRS